LSSDSMPEDGDKEEDEDDFLPMSLLNASTPPIDLGSFESMVENRVPIGYDWRETVWKRRGRQWFLRVRHVRAKLARTSVSSRVGDLASYSAMILKRSSRGRRTFSSPRKGSGGVGLPVFDFPLRSLFRESEDLSRRSMPPLVVGESQREMTGGWVTLPAFFLFTFTSTPSPRSACI
jgi:hypothetical protein